MAAHLHDCYAKNLSQQNFTTASMAENCRKFCLLSVAMERLSFSKLWRTKPKLHRMQELCGPTDDTPNLYWCYRDEDFGGTLASLAISRGGHNSPGSIAQRVLLKLLGKHKCPSIL